MVWAKSTIINPLQHDYNDVTWTSFSLKSPFIRQCVKELMQTQIKKTSKSALLAFCEGNSLVTSESPTPKASNMEKASTSTPIHARAWEEKALVGYDSQQLPTNNNIHKMLIIIISLRWKHFVIVTYLYKIPTINEPYNQRKKDRRQTHTNILTA